MSENLYTPPESNLVNELDKTTSADLASRWSRLGASLVDTVIMMLFLLPTMYFFGWFDFIANGEEPPYLYSLGMGLFGIVLFIIINIKLLKDNGQTVGKKFLGIKIVATNGSKAELKTHLLYRYLTYFLPNQVPFVGSLFQFVNVLFIFRKDKRCIHDLIADTQVVRV